MLVLDTGEDVTSSTLTNVSVPVSPDGGGSFGPRMNGAVVHVPVGDQGVLVFIGGQTTQNPTAYGVQIPDAAHENVMVSSTCAPRTFVCSGLKSIGSSMRTCPC